jgi:hypothetical protein
LNFCSQFDLKERKLWLDSAPFEFQKLEGKKELDFLFVVDSLAFCFWGEPKWKVEYKGNFYDGVWGLLAALRKAIEKEFPILNWEYLANLPENDLREIFKGNVEIPLFKERWNILRENGKILIKKFNGDFERVIEKGKGDALKLLEILVNNFPSFYDSAIYQGKPVFFHKRAQLLVADIYRGKFAKLRNIDQLTGLADYKIPQVLRKFGILKYSLALSEKVDNKILIPTGSEEEIEIRANTIWAIELIKKEIKKKIPDIKSFDIDFYLWFLGQKKSFKDKPYHLTRTIFY